MIGLTFDLNYSNSYLFSRLDDLTSVHRAHVIEHEDIKLRLETCESSITQCENSQSGLEDQYRFFQEMRGYVRDLLECLNEKVGSHQTLGLVVLGGGGLNRGHVIGGVMPGAM